MPKGSIQVSATTGTTGAYILTELHGITCLGGISAGVSGITGYNVQIAKMAWGNTGEYYWIDNTVAEISGAGSSCGRGPLPIQMRDTSGTAISTSAINGQTSRAIDVNIIGQTGTGSSMTIQNQISGGSTAPMAVAGNSAGGHVPVAGDVSGGPIPHIGATGDALTLGPTAGGKTAALYMAATGAFSGTIAAKLRSIASSAHLIAFGGTSHRGEYKVAGLSCDIRSFGATVGVGSVESGITFGTVVTAIAGGVTVGIGSVSVDNPVVIGSSTAGTGGAYAGSGGVQFRSTSVTVQSGVRIKNTHGSGTLTVSYDSGGGTFSNMTGGWDLDDREEVFIEVDNLNKIYVRGTVDAGMNYSYYAT